MDRPLTLLLFIFSVRHVSCDVNDTADCTVVNSFSFDESSARPLIVLNPNSNSPFDSQRYVIRYCQIDPDLKIIKKDEIPSCLSPASTVSWNGNTTRLILPDLITNRTYFVQMCLVYSSDERTINWTRNEYKIVTIPDLNSNDPGPAVFLLPVKSWKPSEVSSIVMLTVGAAGVAFCLPLALVIACRSQRKQRQRSVSLVSGALR